MLDDDVGITVGYSVLNELLLRLWYKFVVLILSSFISEFRLDCESKDGKRGERFIFDSVVKVFTDWNCGILGRAPVTQLLCNELVVADLDGETLSFPVLLLLLLLLGLILLFPFIFDVLRLWFIKFVVVVPCADVAVDDVIVAVPVQPLPLKDESRLRKCLSENGFSSLRGISVELPPVRN